MLDILMIKKLSKPVFAIFLMTPTVRICNAFKACALCPYAHPTKSEAFSLLRNPLILVQHQLQLLDVACVS